MKNNFFKHLLMIAFVSFLTFSCSTDEAVKNDEKSNEVFTVKSGGSTDFTNLLDNLYGTDYEIKVLQLQKMVLHT